LNCLPGRKSETQIWKNCSIDKYFGIKLCNCDMKNAFSSKNCIFLCRCPYSFVNCEMSLFIKKMAQNMVIFPARCGPIPGTKLWSRVGKIIKKGLKSQQKIHRNIYLCISPNLNSSLAITMKAAVQWKLIMCLFVGLPKDHHFPPSALLIPR